jgi:hypothetical protein
VEVMRWVGCCVDVRVLIEGEEAERHQVGSEIARGRRVSGPKRLLIVRFGI